MNALLVAWAWTLWRLDAVLAVRDQLVASLLARLGVASLRPARGRRLRVEMKPIEVRLNDAQMGVALTEFIVRNQYALGVPGLPASMHVAWTVRIEDGRVAGAILTLSDPVPEDGTVSEGSSG